MKGFLKIDAHVHSKGISACSQVSCQQIVDEKMALGYDGAILTNHCQKWYYPPEEHGAFMQAVIDEFRAGTAYADSKGLRLYLGLSVTLFDPHYADWLLYGVTEEFLLSSPCLYQLTQKELFALCEEWGILLVQAHPYRQTPADPKYMHGIEHNGSAGDIDKLPLVEEFAKTHQLLLTCGTDYHFVENKYLGGIFVPENCQTAAEIAAYIKNVKNVKIFIFDEEKSYENAVFVRK